MHRLLFTMLLGLFVAGCGSQKSTFVLLPDPGGTVGKISVTNAQGTQTLNQAGQSVVVSGKGQAPEPTKIMTEEKIRSLFGKAMDIQPSEPSKTLLYFEFNSVQLKPGSKEELHRVVQTATAGNSMDITINGHTDRSGEADYNYALSLRRARHIQKLLEKRGIDPAITIIIAHGESNPLLPTADNVYEPRNRRVEVIIR